jgi:hypothetical protein
MIEQQKKQVYHGGPYFGISCMYIGFHTSHMAIYITHFEFVRIQLN